MELPRYNSPLLDPSSSLTHGFFTRNGGVSTGLFSSLNCSAFSEDEVRATDLNRQRVSEALGAVKLISNKQIHSNQVREVDEATDPVLAMEADGLVTRSKGIAIGALGADCAPVLFFDSDAEIIGAAHAGWQGAVSGVTDAVVEAMCALGASRSSITVAIGPAIQLQSYEVGEVFKQRVLTSSPIPCAQCFSVDQESGQVHFDLPGYIRLRLENAGISMIDQSALDTYTLESEFFSYRRCCHRNEKVYGRQIGAICLTE